MFFQKYYPNDIDEPSFTDINNKKLYDILQVKSVDVGFHWDTDMLMGMILREVSMAETDEELQQAILYKSYGKAVWCKMKNNLDVIKSLV